MGSGSVDDRHAYDAKFTLILREASGVFADKGFHRATIRDIAAATGVSLSGLYYYFESKEELLFQIQSHCFRTLLEQMYDALEGVESAEDRVRVFIRTHLCFFTQNMAEMKVLSHESEALSGEHLEGIRTLKRRYTSILEGALEGLAPADGGVDLRVTTFSLFGMMNWIYTWYRPERDVPLEKLTADISQIVLEGVRHPRSSRVKSGGPITAHASSIWRESSARPQHSMETATHKGDDKLILREAT